MRKAKRQSDQPVNRLTISIRRNRWGQARSLSLSRLSASFTAAIIVMVVLAAGFFSLSYFQLSYDRAHMAEIKRQSQAQERQTEAMKATIKDLKARQAKINLEHNKLKRIMGFDPERPLSKASPSRGGQGGAASDGQSDLLPQDFAASAGELSEELTIAEWESTALEKLWQHDPDRFLSFPTQYPVAVAELSSDYGERKNPFKGRRGEVHHGVDFSGDVGNEVHAAGNGIVVFAAWDSDYGRLIKIDHGNGLVTWYGHNYRMKVTKGQQVKRGDTIALMGSSGRSTGPHVHFAIQRDGEFISPWNYLLQS